MTQSYSLALVTSRHICQNMMKLGRPLQSFQGSVTPGRAAPGSQGRAAVHEGSYSGPLSGAELGARHTVARVCDEVGLCDLHVSEGHLGICRLSLSGAEELGECSMVRLEADGNAARPNLWPHSAAWHVQGRGRADGRVGDGGPSVPPAEAVELPCRLLLLKERIGECGSGGHGFASVRKAWAWADSVLRHVNLQAARAVRRTVLVPWRCLLPLHWEALVPRSSEAYCRSVVEANGRLSVHVRQLRRAVASLGHSEDQGQEVCAVHAGAVREALSLKWLRGPEAEEGQMSFGGPQAQEGAAKRTRVVALIEEATGQPVLGAERREPLPSPSRDEKAKTN
ncbi:unnamed protein product [Gadus morhua 'NCC']